MLRHGQPRAIGWLLALQKMVSNPTFFLHHLTEVGSGSGLQRAPTSSIRVPSPRMGKYWLSRRSIPLAGETSGCYRRKAIVRRSLFCAQRAMNGSRDLHLTVNGLLTRRMNPVKTKCMCDPIRQVLASGKSQTKVEEIHSGRRMARHSFIATGQE